MQDTVLVVPPYPYSIKEDRHDVPLEDCWAARPQLFFSCHLRPKGGRMPKTGCHKTGPDDLRYDLVFFSTFEELKLPITRQIWGGQAERTIVRVTSVMVPEWK